MEEILKIAHRILTRPGRSSVILSVALSALLIIFSVFSAITQNDRTAAAAIPINVTLALFTVGATLLPGLFFRMYCYSHFMQSNPSGSYLGEVSLDRRQKKVALIALVVESLNLTFLLNAYVAAITGGGIGTLGLLAISGFNLLWLIVWGFAALFVFLYLEPKQRIRFPVESQRFF